VTPWKRKEVIGNATLYLGDCLEILPHLPKVDAVITDPPYGVNLGNHKGVDDKRLAHLTKQGYESYEDSPENFLRIVVPAVRGSLALASRGMVFAAAPMMWHLPAPDVIGGIYLSRSVGRNKWGFSSLTHCLLYGTAPSIEKGCRATAFMNSEAAEINGHPTPKPIRWMIWAVDLGSRPSEVILDPFMGSGTTGVACMNLGRKFIGIEIEPKYFEIACERIENAQRQMRMFA
jgi:DNA modification methylase